jgi:hypothetical protein
MQLHHTHTPALLELFTSFSDLACCCCMLCSVCVQPEKLEKQGRTLPRPVRAWPPRDNGKYDTIGQLPPTTQLPQAALPVAAAAVSSS